MHPSSLIDSQLKESLARHAATYREQLLVLLRALAECEQTGFYHQEGFASLLDYCIDGIGMDPHEACERVASARLLHDFPQVEAYLRDGRLEPPSLLELYGVLTPENVDDLLEHTVWEKQERAQWKITDIS